MKVISLLICLVLVCSLAGATETYRKVNSTTFEIVNNDVDATTLNQLEMRKSTLEDRKKILEDEIAKITTQIHEAKKLGIVNR